MAKDNRFPSPANVEVGRDGKAKPQKPKEVVKPAPVHAKQVELTELSYAGDNHLVMPNGFHMLKKGLNFLPKSVFDEAKKHPHIKKMIEEKKIVEAGASVDAEQATAQDSAKEG